MDKIFAFIIHNGLMAVFLIIMLEYACFPVSSEIVLPFAGALSKNNDIPYIILLLISIPAGLIGTTICYLLGYAGGHRLINCITRKFPSTMTGFDYSYSFFDRHGRFAVCVARVIPLCRTYIAFVAGATKQNFSDFLVFSFIGITIWNSVLIGLGYALGSNWGRVKNFYHAYKMFLIPAICFIVFLVLFRKVVKRA